MTKLTVLGKQGFLPEGIEDDQNTLKLLSLICVGIWLILTWIVGIPLKGNTHLSPVISTILGGLTLYMALACNKIINHNFNYTRAVCLNSRTPYAKLERYSKGLIINLVLGLVAIAILGVWLGMIVSLVLFTRFRKRNTKTLNEEYVEGTRLSDTTTLAKIYGSRISLGKASFWFGGVKLPIEEIFTHAKICGTSGSGKTQFMRLYMKGALANIGSIGCDDRGLIFDPKSEFAPFFAGLGIPQENLIFLNPFDARSSAWNMAADIYRSRDASTLANLLIPEKPKSGGSGEFFDKAARRVFAGLTKFFISYAPGKWTLRDLVLGAQNVELVGLLASKDKKLRRDLQVLGSGETAGNVIATISAVIGDELETVAAYLDYHQQQGRTFTLKDWFNSSSILLLGCDRESEATLQPYNQLLVTRFCELATSGEHLGITHAIFDELPALGKIGKKLDELARLGRSYKVPLVIAFQGYSSLKEMYGENIANSLIGQCDKSAYLRVLDHQTAEWASKQIGQTKIRRYTTSSSSSVTKGGILGGNNSTSQSISQNETYETEPAVRPEDIMNIEKPDKATRRGIDGFYKVGSHSYRHYIQSEVLTQYGVTDNPLVAGFEEVSDLDEAEELRLWEEEDLDRLGIADYLHGLDENTLAAMPISDMATICLEAVTPEIVGYLEEAVTA